MTIYPLAGKPAPQFMLVNIPELISAYYTLQPDAGKQAERVSFGTSGHRGSSLNRSFNKAHILAVTQAVCEYRREAGISGTLGTEDIYKIYAESFIDEVHLNRIQDEAKDMVGKLL
ncbi:MAG: hypothetical protein JRC87_10680 [Deltaproteobacteria bacterium]|nr:hypothetical protein [Deltaproteobacteria bacterium]